MKNEIERFIEINEMFSYICKMRNDYLKKCSNIGRMECSLLDYLAKSEDSVYMNSLSEELNVSHSRITRIVDNLVKKKLVRRFPDPKDRRRWCAEITNDGLNIASISNEKEEILQRNILKNIPKEERKQIEEALKRYVNVFLKELGLGEKEWKNQ